MVWAAPFSLATTQGILSFPLGTEMFQFPRCPPLCLCVQQRVLKVRFSRFPHSDIPGSSACSRLPEAFRSDPRPSSATGAKASSVSPFFLLHVFRRSQSPFTPHSLTSSWLCGGASPSLIYGWLFTSHDIAFFATSRMFSHSSRNAICISLDAPNTQYSLVKVRPVSQLGNRLPLWPVVSAFTLPEGSALATEE